MLYDPKWEKTTETKAEPSLAGLVAWLETQNPSTTYEWSDCSGRCLIGLYCGSLGYSFDDVCAYETDPHSAIYYKLTTSVPGHEGLALRTPHTFGAALQRAREALEAQPRS